MQGSLMGRVIRSYSPALTEVTRRDRVGGYVVIPPWRQHPRILRQKQKQARYGRYGATCRTRRGTYQVTDRSEPPHFLCTV